MTRLPKSGRLRLKSDFTTFFQNASRYDHPYVRIYVAPKSAQRSRVAVVASRYVGNAVQRNWCKRRLREVYRFAMDRFDPNYDVVLVAKQRMVGQSSSAIRDAVLELLGRIS